jgi:hypothetical protein
MHGYDPAAWAVFFASATGAAAALTGLLFVAVSINLSRILSGLAMLPARAAETLMVLLFVVIIPRLPSCRRTCECSASRSWSSACP